MLGPQSVPLSLQSSGASTIHSAESCGPAYSCTVLKLVPLVELAMLIVQLLEAPSAIEAHMRSPGSTVMETAAGNAGRISHQAEYWKELAPSPQ